MSDKEKKYFVYHSGIDELYMASDLGFDPSRYVQAKGSILDWQCKERDYILDARDLDCDSFDFDLIEGRVKGIPTCEESGRPLRPNIQFRSDMDWMEDRT